MPCFTPLKAYRAPGGSIAFDSARGWSDRPLELRCRNCIGCRQDRARAWALRCVHESLLHERNCFVTLTYDDEHLPNDGGLDVRHWQLFAKRLRKAIGPFRFYHCGEYGEKTRRPHYHALLFGQDLAGDWMLLRHQNGSDVYTSRLLQQTWGLGEASIDHLNYSTAEYVTRYCMKKLNGNLGAETYGTLRPPYATMSRGGRTGLGGIGSTWFDKYYTDVYPSDEVVHAGRKFRPPKYYDDKLAQKLGPEALEALRVKRLTHMNKENSTHQRLKVREKVQLARMKAYDRNTL